MIYVKDPKIALISLPKWWEVNWTDKFYSADNTIAAIEKDDTDNQLNRGHFCRSGDGSNGKFKGMLQDNDVAARLFQAYDNSFYGCQIWNMSKC